MKIAEKSETFESMLKLKLKLEKLQRKTKDKFSWTFRITDFNYSEENLITIDIWLREIKDDLKLLLLQYQTLMDPLTLMRKYNSGLGSSLLISRKY